MRPTGILICVPAYQWTMNAQTAETLFRLAQCLTVERIPHYLTWFSGADIAEVRNLFLTAWYDANPECSHMLFIDADMGFKPTLVRDMIKFDKPLMGTIYRKRQAELAFVGKQAEGHGYKDVVNGFIKTLELGTGVMMISRRVVDAILKKYPHLIDPLPSVMANGPFQLNRVIRAFDPIREGNLRLSEDLSFCRRWMDCGGEIWANVDHVISHVGPYDFHHCYLDTLKENARIQSEAA